MGFTAASNIKTSTLLNTGLTKLLIIFTTFSKPIS